MPLGELAHRHTSVWLPKPIMEKEKWRSFLFCFVFLKALGYFLLPSSFFPEQEFTTPHGFLMGEVGESPRISQQGFLSQPSSWEVASSCALPALLQLAVGSCFLKSFFFKGKEKYQTTRTTQEEEKKKATFEHFPTPIRLRLSYSSPEIIMKKHFRQNT